MEDATEARPFRAALETLRAERDGCWALYAAARPDTPPEILAWAIVDDPAAYEWRLVDAALERLGCSSCGSGLGAGPRGCGTCDLADGYRFAAREVDRPGVPEGNEHAIRVASAVLRSPQRYPDSAVRGNELYLPLFMAGKMPRRAIKQRLLRALGRAGHDRRLESATTFDELLSIAEAADAGGCDRSGGPRVTRPGLLRRPGEL